MFSIDERRLVDGDDGKLVIFSAHRLLRDSSVMSVIKCHQCDQPLLPGHRVCPHCGWVRPSRDESEVDVVRIVVFFALAALIVVVAAVLGVGF